MGAARRRPPSWIHPLRCALDSVRPVLGTRPRGPILHIAQRIAATAAALLAVAIPAAAHQQEPVPPVEQPTEQPVEVQGPPASTHEAFVPVPDQQQACTSPVCGSVITVGPGDVDESEYRALVDA